MCRCIKCWHHAILSVPPSFSFSSAFRCSPFRLNVVLRWIEFWIGDSIRVMVELSFREKRGSDWEHAMTRMHQTYFLLFDPQSITYSTKRSSLLSCIFFLSVFLFFVQRLNRIICKYFLISDFAPDTMDDCLAVTLLLHVVLILKKNNNYIPLWVESKGLFFVFLFFECFKGPFSTTAFLLLKHVVVF